MVCCLVYIVCIEYTTVLITHTACMQESKKDALRLFTEDVEEMRRLPRQQVLDHLSNHAPTLVVPYLVS